MTPDPFQVAVAFPVTAETAPGGVDQPCGKCGVVLRLGPRIAAAVQAQPLLLVVCPTCFVDITPGGAAALDAWIAERDR